MATRRGSLTREKDGNDMIVPKNSNVPGTSTSQTKKEHVNGFKRNGINGKNGKHEHVSCFSHFLPEPFPVQLYELLRLVCHTVHFATLWTHQPVACLIDLSKVCLNLACIEGGEKGENVLK